MPPRNRHREKKKLKLAGTNDDEYEQPIETDAEGYAIEATEPELERTTPVTAVLRSVDAARHGDYFGKVFRFFADVALYHDTGPWAVQLHSGPATLGPPWDFLTVPEGADVVIWNHQVRNWNFFGFRRIRTSVLIAVVPRDNPRASYLWLGLYEPNDTRRFAYKIGTDCTVELRQIIPNATGGLWARDISAGWSSEDDELIAGTELARSGKLLKLWCTVDRDLSGYLYSTGHMDYMWYSEYATDTEEANANYQQHLSIIQPGYESHAVGLFEQQLAECNT